MAKPLNTKLFNRIVEEAKAKFRWPSPTADAWVMSQYKKRGGKFADSRSGIKDDAQKSPGVKKRDDKAQIPLTIAKSDSEKRLVFGYAKFSEDPTNRGHYYIDRQGDIITPADLESSAYDYVLHSRDSGEMHVSKGAGTLVESFVSTPDKLERMGLPPDSLPVGWWVGYRIHEVEKGQPDPFDKIKSGEYTGFSVEGSAVRTPVDVQKAQPTASDVHVPSTGGPSSAGSAKSECECDGDEHDKDCPLCITKADDDEGLTTDEKRQLIINAQRSQSITPSEADEMLRRLVPEDAPLREDGTPSLTPEQMHFIAEMLTHLSMVAKHEGEDHPESSHGNRLFKPEADPVGDLLKRLKTRFKRTDVTALRGLQDKFAKSTGEKDALSHDQIVAELARRNIISAKDMKFKSTRFNKLKDEIAAAMTE